jgi:undecaprenyl diphosphate synthase
MWRLDYYMTEERHIPTHVAIIMDGNGRWASKRLMPRTIGHREGGKVLERTIEDAYNMGIRYLTVFAFSTENWSRKQSEVDSLMDILRDYLSDSINKSKKNRMVVRVIGDKSRFAPDIRQSMETLERVSADNDGIHFQVALNYGGRDEILRAAKKLSERVLAVAGRDSEDSFAQARDYLESFTADDFDSLLDTGGMPPLDLLIRTSGEQRISNFLLWQLAYSEIYYTDVLWPDFSKKELEKAVEYYSSRSRRFGK